MKRIHSISISAINLLSLRISVIMLWLAATATSLFALPETTYREHSVLAEGNWAKVSVTNTGINLISNADLRSLGFENPAKVRVFGYGGRQLLENLSEETIFDLPEQPVVVTDKGILFFGTDNNLWVAGSKVPYNHYLNGYATSSVYFLTDRDDLPAATFEPIHTGGLSDKVNETFSERLVHEQELVSPALIGRQLFGEDFRSNRTQNFSFELTDYAGGEAFARVVFGALASTSSELSFTGNKEPLTEISGSPRIYGKSSSYDTMKLADVSLSVPDPGKRLDFGITFQPGSVLTHARLDFIEVFYPRLLRLSNGQINFYANAKSGESFAVDGCSGTTRIYDVTNPGCPRPVEYTLQGSKACFTVDAAGYYEFVAFEPSKINMTASVVGKIDNQDIHGLPTPDMVIITLPEYMDGAKRIAALHDQVDGFTVHVIEASKIYNEFGSGVADVTAFRKMLKRWYDRPGDRKLGYCLLMGKASYDNKLLTSEARGAGFTPMPIWQDHTGTAENDQPCIDDYIGYLSDSSDISKKPRNKSDFVKEPLSIGVGRVPCTNSVEASTYADKLESYLLRPEYGPWRNRIMLIADDGNSNSHLDQANKVIEGIETTPLGKGFVMDRLYEDAYQLEMTSLGPSYPIATARLLRAFSEGEAFINYIGHGSPSGLGHENLLRWTDIVNLRNTNYSIFAGYTCRFLHWDENDISGGEHIVMNPIGGSIATYAATRTVFVQQNGNLNAATAPFMTGRDEEGLPMRLGDAIRLGKNKISDSNKLAFCIAGDPAIRFPGGAHTVEIETINKNSLADNPDDYPELRPLSSNVVAGTVRDIEGNIDEDYNGTLNLQLYDAERVVTTFGNNDGYSTNYNDRSTRLAMVTAKIEKGRWEATVQVPADIEYNYSPARLVAYAWSENGEEANGSNERFYVYGEPESGSTDEEGPEIDHLYLNTPGFSQGDVVGPNPVLFARFHDPSGINLSDAGIGHKISLNIDDKIFYTDLDAYYSADSSEPGAGSVVYPLSELEAGNHTLHLTVWDNANNSTTAELTFSIGAAVTPTIVSLGTDVNPATTSVKFIVDTDRPNSAMNCAIEVIDLNGRVVWESDSRVATTQEGRMTSDWNLCDKSGHRVPRGIYLYRATVITDEGPQRSQTKKLAVTAQ